MQVTYVYYNQASQYIKGNYVCHNLGWGFACSGRRMPALTTPSCDITATSMPSCV
jgi:hypothetical protein